MACRRSGVQFSLAPQIGRSSWIPSREGRDLCVTVPALPTWLAVFGILFARGLSTRGPRGVYLCGGASGLHVRPGREAGGGRRVRTGTEASLTVSARPWQNQTAGRGRGPTGGSGDASEHPRGVRPSPWSGVDTGHGHPAQLPFLWIPPRRPGPRGQRRHFLRVHGLRPQLELIDGCTQA
jgi:hypothetical protein